MEKPSGSPSSSSTPPSKRSSEEPLLELPQSLKDQGVEFRIVMSIQPLSSHPPPSNTRSPYESSLESLIILSRLPRVY